jgi:hypothetical protein
MNDIGREVDLFVAEAKQHSESLTLALQELRSGFAAACIETRDVGFFVKTDDTTVH